MNSKYINGNYIVINESYKKTYVGLRVGEPFESEFPDSIDLKITNLCSIGCPYCHESSSPLGKVFDIDKTIKILSKLPKVGIEIAIGGGDILTCPLKVSELVSWLRNNNFFPRVTINYKSIKLYSSNSGAEIDDLLNFNNNIGGIGISIDEFREKDIENVNNSLWLRGSNSIVYHIIAGIFPISDIKPLIESNNNVLILGYKNFGRAYGVSPKYSIKEWEKELKRVLYRYRYDNLSSKIAFDNLALEQLNIKDSLTTEEWEKFYMGKEFSHSMYIDAVEGIFSPSSRDSFRMSWDDIDILSFFKKYKKIDNGQLF